MAAFGGALALPPAGCPPPQGRTMRHATFPLSFNRLAKKLLDAAGAGPYPAPAAIVRWIRLIT